ncbi:MAG: NifU family protein [Bacteroidia bacterium]|nr:NifU family protein [Bacteroidia bacterium]MCX7652005.1 NifU family protein [Bacteroidia bacterium]MDW8416324.1 NifU family protein [Bacteroidia bacterium]
MKATLENIASYLGPIRSYLAIDGGDIEVVSLSPDGKRLYVRLLGSCRTCDLNSTTIQLGVLEPLRRHFPSLEVVEIVPE